MEIVSDEYRTGENMEKPANRNPEWIRKEMTRANEMIGKVLCCSDDVKFW